MIPTYSDYIARYVAPTGLKGSEPPGEHHFVAVYLVPKLYHLNGIVPDYVNPEGAKALVGDVIYSDNASHRCGIEVKLGVIRLTPDEFNNWIVREDRSCWPNIFLGVGSAGILLLSWSEFRSLYTRSVSAGAPDWSPAAIQSGYGPLKSVNTLMTAKRDVGQFPISSDPRVARQREVDFVDALARAIEG